MKNILIFSFAALLFACAEKDKNQIGTVTVGNPLDRTSDSALGLQFRYASNLHFEENPSQRYLQLDNRSLLSRSAQNERLSFLRIEAVQTPADSGSLRSTLSELEAFAASKFPQSRTKVIEGLDNRALGVRVIQTASANLDQRDDFILLEDRTLLQLSLKLWKKDPGTAEIRGSYSTTQYKSGSSDLPGGKYHGGVTSAPLRVEPPESQTRPIRSTVTLTPAVFVFDREWGISDGVYQWVAYVSDREILQGGGVAFEGLNGAQSQWPLEESAVPVSQGRVELRLRDLEEIEHPESYCLTRIVGTRGSETIELDARPGSSPMGSSRYWLRRSGQPGVPTNIAVHCLRRGSGF